MQATFFYHVDTAIYVRVLTERKRVCHGAHHHKKRRLSLHERGFENRSRRAGLARACPIRAESDFPRVHAVRRVDGDGNVDSSFPARSVKTL